LYRIEGVFGEVNGRDMAAYYIPQEGERLVIPQGNRAV
jgi:hypothetical protein